MHAPRPASPLLLLSRAALVSALVVALATFVSPLLAQESAPATPAGAPGKLRVVSLSPVLTDFAKEIGGDKVDVVGLVKPGVDPHTYDPTPADAQQVSSTQVVLISGKGLEGYLTKFRQAAGGKATWVDVGAALPSLEAPEHDHDHDDDHDHHHHHHGADPHWWHSVANAKLAVGVIREAFAAAAPADKEYFAGRAAEYLEKLDAMDKEIKVALADLPRDARKLVTSHDAFQYFAKERGFTIIAISGISTRDQPSSKKIVKIINQIRADKVKAVFYESVENPKVIAEITKETGAKVGGSLVADGLGEGAASTYIGMMKANATTIVQGLK
ncbi:ABC transporter substrate-binding protein [Verrucomicrobia bacterium LW23]|nr:ABC transporter substrate-binding protein [Verrucomicrobia bacterium LW23]